MRERAGLPADTPIFTPTAVSASEVMALYLLARWRMLWTHGPAGNLAINAV